MTGKNHIIANTSTMAAAGSIFSYIVISMPRTHEYLLYLSDMAREIKPLFFSEKSSFSILTLVVSIFLFYLGTVFPDADSPNSLFGKYFHIPVEHRTWLHAIYISLISFLVSIFWLRPLFWFGLGYFLHLVYDAPSYMGVCFFYPFSNYVKYASGAKVKKGHKLKLYRYGDLSEKLFVFIVVSFMAMICYHFYKEFSLYPWSWWYA